MFFKSSQDKDRQQPEKKRPDIAYDNLAIPEIHTGEVQPEPEKPREKTPAIPQTEQPAAAPSQPAAKPPVPIRQEEPAAPVRGAPAPGRKEKANTAREVAEQTAAVTAEIEQKLADSENAYQFPPITLLHENRNDNFVEAGAELRNNSRRLAETLSSFGVDAKAGDVIHGPSVTRYEFTLDQGVKLSKITNLQDDIAL